MKHIRIFSKGLRAWVRDFHCYFGLFISPFILIFALDEESGYEREVIAQVLTEEDEYTVGLDELESVPDDTRNSKYLEMYKYWIRGLQPYEQG